MDEIEQFELKEAHIKLLRNSNVQWNRDEFGSAGVDPKRPYGNSSTNETFADIARILGEELKLDENDEPTEPQMGRLYKIHQQTGTALQVILDTGSFEPGIYLRKMYDEDGKWKSEYEFNNTTKPPKP